jgi:hypothetical protein
LTRELCFVLGCVREVIFRGCVCVSKP